MEGRIEKILGKVLPDIHNGGRKLSLVNRAAASCMIIAITNCWDGLIYLAILGFEIIPISRCSCLLNTLRVLFRLIFLLQSVSHNHKGLIEKERRFRIYSS